MRRIVYDAGVLAPLVLAAGRSSRMGSPKALLRDREGRSFIARIVRSLGEAGFGAVTVVTSAASHEAIAQALAADRPPVETRLALNQDPERGQLSSIWTGMDAAVTPAVTGILLTLVDVPFVSSRTIRAVVDAYEAAHAPIVRPADGDRHGHPVIFDRTMFRELRDADLHAGAKVVVRAHEYEILNVVVDDEGAFLDIDTPDDYAEASRSS